MPRIHRSFRALPLLGAFTGVVMLGCSHSDDSKTSAALGQDSSLAHDLEMVNSDTAAQPQLRDVPAPPEKTTLAEQSSPSRSRPAPPARRRTEPPVQREEPQQVARVTPTPPTPHPVPVQPLPPLVNPPARDSASLGDGHTNGTSAGMGVIGAGSMLSLTSGQRICTNTHSVGDRFTATVAEPVEGTNGVVIPRGATAVFELTTLKKAEGARDSAIVRFTLRAVAIGGKSYPASGEVTEEQVERVASATNHDGRKVAAGAAIGAIAGQLFGHKTKSTVIGAATGAVVGAGVALATAKFDGCVPNGGKILVRLSQPITVARQ